MDKLFTKIAQFTGSIPVFFISLGSLIAWTILGFYCGWTEVYLMVGTVVMSAVSFLVPFIIQHSQSKDTRSLHLKLDELIRVINEADDKYRHIEKLSDKELESLEDNR